MMKLKLDINFYITEDAFKDQTAIYETIFEMQKNLQKHGYTGTRIKVVDNFDQNGHMITRETAISYDKNKGAWFDSEGHEVGYQEYHHL